jgi:putative polyketide hydroxylase
MLKTITSRTQVISPVVGLFGYQYPKGAFVPDGRGESPFDRLDTQARTGTRIPHLWLRRNGTTVSTLDFAGPGFALLAGAGGDDWVAAAAAVTERDGTQVTGHRIGTGTDVEDDGQWAAATGCGPCDALLVRPDGIVAWRSEGAPGSVAEATRVLGNALGALSRQLQGKAAR